MSSLLLLWLGVFCVAWSASGYRMEDAESHFEQFIQKYDRQYANNAEKQARFQIFKENLETVIQKNMKRDIPIFGITQFMDLTLEEFINSYTGLKPDLDFNTDKSCDHITDADVPDGDAPESFDWREQHAVSPVKNQLHCGSCYAFSSIGNVESQYAIKHKEMILLSEQQIVDCDKTNYGCYGGYMSVALRTLIDEGGSETEEDYKYTGKEKNCRFNETKVRVKVTNCYSYNLTSQEKVKQVLYHRGPISIAIQASGLPMLSSAFGGLGDIVTDKECNVGMINHAVLLVGYGTEKDVPYWIVKNSWGPEWCEHGYFRIQRGENRTSCGMMNTMMASAVVA